MSCKQTTSHGVHVAEGDFDEPCGDTRSAGLEDPSIVHPNALSGRDDAVMSPNRAKVEQTFVADEVDVKTDLIHVSEQYHSALGLRV